MTGALFIPALWLGLALLAGLLSNFLGVSSALAEIVTGMIAQSLLGTDILGTHDNWVRFLSAAGAILLTFLAGAELDRTVFKLKWKEASAVGLASFLLPFLGCTAGAHYALGWGLVQSWLAGIALSTTSAAIIYAVILEVRLNTTEYGKTILAACFITDVATVVALGLTFTPFTMKTSIAIGMAAVVLLILPWFTPRFFKRFGGLLSELETKFLLFCLLGLGALANWAESEAVLAGYATGMVLAGSVGKDHALIRRLRTLTFGLLTPFFFILAGSLISVPALIAAPGAFLFFVVTKVAAKFIGVFPLSKYFGSENKSAAYTSLLMSTGLTLGMVAALFGRSHGIIDASQYSAIVAAVVGTAFVPTIIANAFFLPDFVTEPQPETAPLPSTGMLGRILHANDGSENAFRALELALVIAKQNHSELHMVSVGKAGYRPEFETPREEVREETGAARRFHNVLRRAREMAQKSEVDLHTHGVPVHSVRSIVDLAADLKAELLVIGEKGQLSLYERLIGSRADRVMRLAPCPVLIVK
ncbi:MAG TPA: cation:proton antiporter [Methylocella sp.]|nr:cation:proton antiporter [Methylocella sp.]